MQIPMLAKCVLAIVLAAFLLSCHKETTEIFREQRMDNNPLLSLKIPSYVVKIDDFLKPGVFDDNIKYFSSNYASLVFSWRNGKEFSNVYVSIRVAPSVGHAQTLFDYEAESRSRWIDQPGSMGDSENRCSKSLVVYEPAEKTANALRQPYYHSFVLYQKGRVFIRIWEQSSDWRNLKKDAIIRKFAQEIKDRV